MKRFYIAVILLCTVFFGGLWNLYFISDTVETISTSLTQAQQLTKEDFSSATALLEQANQIYTQRERYLSIVVSETLLNAVRSGFLRTSSMAAMQDDIQFSLELSGLRQAVNDLLRSEAFGLANLF